MTLGTVGFLTSASREEPTFIVRGQFLNPQSLLTFSRVAPCKQGRTWLSCGNESTPWPLLFSPPHPTPPRKPADLQNLAPGTNPPFMTFDGEVKTDVNKIEEFLEEKLAPPR